jgi:hypothetical protein
MHIFHSINQARVPRNKALYWLGIAFLKDLFASWFLDGFEGKGFGGPSLYFDIYLTL